MIGSSRLLRWALEVALVALAIVGVFSGNRGFERWLLGGASGERSVYMKLPLEQPRFHWYFTDESALLRGSLEIEIHGAGGRDTVLTVFRDGRMTPGWEPISRGDRGTYFGFVGHVRVWTEPKDSVVVRLKVAEELGGVGAYREGVLHRGAYEAVASYHHLTGHPDLPLIRRIDGPTAFIGCWRTKWKLDVTRERGWMGSVADERDPVADGWLGRVEERAFGPRGTDGFRCLDWHPSGRA